MTAAYETTSTTQDALAHFAGTGEMSRRCREFDWTGSALGPPADWPVELRATAALVLASPFPMALLWGDALSQIYNDAYRALMGTKHPAGIGQGARECWPETWHSAAPLYDAVRRGESIVVDDVLHQSGTEAAETSHWFRLGYSPVRTSAGAVAGVLVTALETTAKVLAQRAASAAARAKGDFLTVMSHELRTPLNAIGGYAELLGLEVRGPITPEQRGDLLRIQQSQRQLLDVINGVLDYAKVEAGVLHYAVEDVLMDEVRARCEALVATQLREAGLELRHGSCDTGLAARADAEKVQQIVLNLLSNAIKFTLPGGRVTLSCAAEHEQRLVVRVSDTGSGIAATDLECVFQPFVQVDAKRTRAHEGAGLGLAISREMARGMGGDLCVESSLGDGSTFTLTLACGRRDSLAGVPGKRGGDERC